MAVTPFVYTYGSYRGHVVSKYIVVGVYLDNLKSGSLFVMDIQEQGGLSNKYLPITLHMYNSVDEVLRIVKMFLY